jgi:phosphatidate cytidylyltransferase
MRLGLRLGSAAVLVVLLLGALILRGPVLDALAAAALAVACWEFSGLTRRIGGPPLAWLLFPLALFLLLRHTYPSDWQTLDWALSGAVVLGLVGMLAPPKEALDRGMLRWAASVGGALYLGLTLGYLLILVNLPDGISGIHAIVQLAPGRPEIRVHGGYDHVGQKLVAIALASAMIGDSAALFVGSAIGRRPFFPSISPKKSLEGALGGVAATILTWALAAPPLIGLPVLHAVILGAVIAVAAQAGDLVESALKRAARVKDSSELIPGHGGLLDRLDSLLLLGPVVYAYVVMTGLP